MKSKNREREVKIRNTAMEAMSMKWNTGQNNGGEKEN